MIKSTCEIRYGSKFWYHPTTCRLHREDGPAIEWVDGHHEWRQNGVRHRTDGPAVTYPNGDHYYWINGHPIPDIKLYNFVVNKKANV